MKLFNLFKKKRNCEEQACECNENITKEESVIVEEEIVLVKAKSNFTLAKELEKKELVKIIGG